MDQSFMAAIVDCLLRAAPHFQNSEFIEALSAEFARLGETRPELAQRYRDAVEERNAAEIERLLRICQPLGERGAWIGNLRVNAVTGKMHVGDGNRSAALFPAS